MSDRLYSGRAFRTFNVIDHFNREALWIEVDTEFWIPWLRSVVISSACVVIMARVRSSFAWHLGSRVPGRLDCIEPGRPIQNAYTERFNRTYREEVFALYSFNSHTEVRTLTQQWLNTLQDRSSTCCPSMGTLDVFAVYF